MVKKDDGKVEDGLLANIDLHKTENISTHANVVHYKELLDAALNVARR